MFCCTGHCCQKAHETTFKYLKSCEGQTPSIKRARLDEVRLLQWLKVESDADSSQQLIHHHLQDQAPHIKKMTALMKYVCTFKFTTKCTSIVFAVNNIIFGNILYVSLILPHLFLCFVYSWIVDFVHLVLIILYGWIADGPDNSLDSQKTQTWHYRTLQEMYKAKKPNKAAVTHLLDLEFPSRRNFIDSNALKEPQNFYRHTRASKNCTMWVYTET